ncbi:dentin sialophosphoprotein-like [Uloborus diversus]|uniref:dentin sialophosphoprotein-like n=1 Tax=Uloborus diversus TaxID=327109 RepID=UPI0024092013|nr:dentin sialophosphoprotein-like [Uloborus diversus]
MTLVLPFGGDQINNSLFSGTGSSRNSSMPCVFDGEALDFESALMTDWTSDISDYSTPADDFTTPAPSDSSDLKRKSSISDNEVQPSQPKKLRTDHDEDSVDHMQSDIVSSSTSSSLSIDFNEPTTSSSSTSPSSYLDHTSLDSTSSSPTSSSEEQEASPAEDEDYLPRRRGPQMWNSRQRWKDERKKVLKMSVNKLTEIEDPELCLLRSVLINNTIKRLHFDIRNERQAKIRQRQQRMDYYAEKFQPLDVLGDDTPTSTDPFVSELDNHGRLDDEPTKSCTSSSDLYDESSCDEIFGISEDFLRVAIPDRRVSSPVPTSQPDSSDMDTSNGASGESEQSIVATSNTQTTCYTSSNSSPQLSSSCDNAIDCASSRFYPENTAPSSTLSSDNSSSGVSSYSVSSSFRRLVGQVNGGTQCATQFRTNGVGSGGDNIFPPRVPILDSVVYHSLLASLESS